MPRKRPQKAGHLAGRYQAWLAPFSLRWDRAACRYWRYFDMGDRVWTDPKSWSIEEVTALLKVQAWRPIAPGSDGMDYRPMRRLLEAALERNGEELVR